MRVLAFRHVPFEGVGLIGPVLEERGLSLEYADLYRADAELPEIKDAAGLIFLGGPMSVNDGLPYLKQESDLIARAVERKQPILGICLGSQLIAQALGSRVYLNSKKEIGWFDIHLTAAAPSDPLFAGVNPSETVFHWHSEAFDLPPGARSEERSAGSRARASTSRRSWPSRCSRARGRGRRRSSGTR